jgi:ADP-heptose:LPS heptosyltransferase
MNFVESLSLCAGLKYSKPFIEESFFPVVPEKYVTFCTENHQSKQWDHFQEYLNIITPILKKNGISVVEIGDNEVKLNASIISLKGATGPNHWSYVIRNSLLHVGPENFISQLASFHNTPFIAFFSNTSSEYSAPIWSDKKNQILIKADLKFDKPSFLASERIKTINNIPAEEVAQKTLDALNIKNDFNKYEIFSIGSHLVDFPIGWCLLLENHHRKFSYFSLQVV